MPYRSISRPRHPRIETRRLAILILVGLIAGLALGAARNASADISPGLSAVIDGREIAMPTLKVDMQTRLLGDLASVRVSHTFANPYTVPIHARYVFPLPSDAAVYAMRFISGEEMIEAEIHERGAARAVYENAKERGNQAALLEQHRPNVFTQEVANLTPGAVVRVELEYAHAVEKSHGDYRFHFPMIVGPRYLPPVLQGGSTGAPTGAPGEPAALEVGVWNLPASAPVAPPERVDRERVSVRVELDAGLPIQRLESPSHRLAVERTSDSKRTIELAHGRTLDNQDFELHYRLEGDAVSAGLTTWAEPGDGYLALLFEPPKRARDDEIARRELVFVLDCSGSMAGTPLAASKRFMRRSLNNLRSGDSFRIIRFSDAATAWSEQPLPATPDNVRAGVRYVDALYGSGGTHMASGIRAALAPAIPEQTLRLVVFLTDGYIGNDVEIIRLLEQQRGDARLFAFGIGNAVNRFLIEEMGRVGRGAARVVRPGEDAQTAADELVERLDAPVLTDIEIDWGEAQVADATPREIPDLFMGQTVRVLARYTTSGTFRATIHGRVAGRPIQLPLDLELPAHDTGLPGKALPIVWARHQIKDRMIHYRTPRLADHERDAIQEEVTKLGLSHRLMTRWTSFVAVAKPVVNPGGRGRNADVEVPQVAGVPEAAYPASALPPGTSVSPSAAPPNRANGPLPPNPPQAAPRSGSTTLVQGNSSISSSLLAMSSSGFHGATGPEPASWLALAAIAIASGAVWRRRNEAHSKSGG